MKVFVGWRAKAYSYLTHGSDESKNLKGTKKECSNLDLTKKLNLKIKHWKLNLKIK